MGTEQKQEEFIDYTPINGQILIQGDDSAYQSKNGIISTLSKASNTIRGTVLKSNSNIHHIKEEDRVIFMKYDGTELITDLFCVEASKIKLIIQK